MSSVRQDRIPLSQLVSIKITNTAQTLFQLPDQSNLRNQRIIGVEAFSVSLVPKAPDNNNTINATAFSKCYLTLVDTNKITRMDRMPFYALSRANNNGNFVSVDFQIDLQKSFIEYPDTATALVANETFLLNFYYEDRNIRQ